MLSRRELKFLNESNKIHGLSNLEYSFDSKEGYPAAWKLLREKAENSKHLTPKDILDSQFSLLRELKKQKKIGNTTGFLKDVDGFFLNLQTDLAIPMSNPVDIAAIYHRKFQNLYSSLIKDGRLGMLISNYIMNFLKSPIIVFNSNNRDNYFDSLNSDELSIEYFRNSFRQITTCFFCHSDYVERKREGIESDFYTCEDCGESYNQNWEEYFAHN